MSSITLDDDHELQVQAYLRFAKLKRDQHVRETLSVIRDHKADKLQPGEMYNYKDMTAVFDELEAEVKTLVDKEIQHAYHTNALLVKLLLSQAQTGGLRLSVDTTQLENEFLLKAIANSESTALARPVTDFARRGQQLSRLGSISAVPGSDTGGATAKQVADLKEELAATQARLRKLQEQATAALTGKSSTNAELQSLKDQLATAQAQLQDMQAGKSAAVDKLQGEFRTLSTVAAGAASASQSQYEEVQRQLNEHRTQLNSELTKAADLQHKLAQREAEVKELKSTLDGRMDAAPQVKQLRTLMAAKSAECVELRRRLNKYEAEPVPSADA